MLSPVAGVTLKLALGLLPLGSVVALPLLALVQLIDEAAQRMGRASKEFAVGGRVAAEPAHEEIALAGPLGQPPFRVPRATRDRRAPSPRILQSRQAHAVSVRCVARATVRADASSLETAPRRQKVRMDSGRGDFGPPRRLAREAQRGRKLVGLLPVQRTKAWRKLAASL
jgi:hypothetical protein